MSYQARCTTPFGSWLRSQRLARGWSLAEFGVQSGLSFNYYAQIELGKRHCGPTTALRIAEGFGIDYAEVQSRNESSKKYCRLMGHEGMKIIMASQIPADVGNSYYPTDITDEEKERLSRHCGRITRHWKEPLAWVHVALPQSVVRKVQEEADFNSCSVAEVCGARVVASYRRKPVEIGRSGYKTQPEDYGIDEEDIVILDEEADKVAA